MNDLNIVKVIFCDVQMQRCSVNKAFLKISQNSQENTCARAYFLNKVAGLRQQLY